MNTDINYEFKTNSPSLTLGIGDQIGLNCKGGELFLLTSDLGGGKTTFTKGLAKGLGSEDTVTSPTFTVSNIYNCRDGIELHHFDFYRLSEGGMVEYELAEIINDPKIVIVVEWGDVVTESLPENKILISLKRVASGEDDRLVSVSLPKCFNYLLTP